MKALIALLFTITFTAAALYAAETAGTAPAKHDCAECPLHKKAAAGKAAEHKCPLADKENSQEGTLYPAGLKDVEKAVKNTANGVEITMTAKDKTAVEKVQQMAVDHYSGKTGMKNDCPCRVSGAETAVENTADGVKVTITGKAPGIVKKIQELAARKGCNCGKHGEKAAAAVAKHYICPMKCPGSESDKPGKCPKCGMPLVEKK